ncbi:MAG: protein kinase [Phycisphaerales bacterium]
MSGSEDLHASDDRPRSDRRDEAGDPVPTTADLATFARGDAVPTAIRSAIAADPDLLTQVAEMRANNQFIDELLDLGTGSVLPEVGAPDGLSIPGYTLLGRVARGGQAVVYRARQTSTGREVALKVLLDGAAAAPSRRRRFVREIEVVAALQHPGVVVVYDSGETADGRLYFTMEYVDGLPITDWAQQESLSTAARLELVRDIAVAVQYAHGRGVIHRDLKPANVLADERGRPRVLDFGIAGVLNRDARSTTIETSVGQLLGTLPYMSPEQIGGAAFDVDVRSDVYALGVLAYELLAGHPPLDLSSAPLAEAVRVVQQVEPVRLGRVNAKYRGDVETIVARALEKDPDRRYQTAAELARDIERHLADQPIIAHPPSLMYQFRKFSRRNRGLVVGSGLAAIAVVGGLAATTTLSVRLSSALDEAEARTSEAQTAQADAEFARNGAEQARDGSAATFELVEALLGTAIDTVDGSNTPLRTVLIAVSEDPDRLLDDLPADQASRTLATARLFSVLCTLAGALDEYSLANDFGDRAIDAWGQVDEVDQDLLARVHETTGDALRRLGGIATDDDRFDRARVRYETANRLRTELNQMPEATYARLQRGDVDSFEAGQLASAIRIESDSATTDALAARRDARLASAERIATDVESRVRDRIAAMPKDAAERERWLPILLEACENQGFASIVAGDVEAALRHLERGMAYASPDNPRELSDWSTMAENRADLLGQMGRTNESLAAYADVVDRTRAVTESTETVTIRTSTFARALLRARRFDEAQVVAADAWNKADAALAPSELGWRHVRWTMARVDAATGDFDSSIEHVDALIAEWQRTSGIQMNLDSLIRARWFRANLLASIGDFEGATVAFDEAYRTSTSDAAAPEPSTARLRAYIRAIGRSETPDRDRRRDLLVKLRPGPKPGQVEVPTSRTVLRERMIQSSIDQLRSEATHPVDPEEVARLDDGVRTSPLEQARWTHDLALILWLADDRPRAAPLLERLRDEISALDPWRLEVAQSQLLLARAAATGVLPAGDWLNPIASATSGLSQLVQLLGPDHPVLRRAQDLRAALSGDAEVDGPSLDDLIIIR